MTDIRDIQRRITICSRALTWKKRLDLLEQVCRRVLQDLDRTAPSQHTTLLLRETLSGDESRAKEMLRYLTGTGSGSKPSIGQEIAELAAQIKDSTAVTKNYYKESK
jgi:hypothetical protein